MDYDIISFIKYKKTPATNLIRNGYFYLTTQKGLEPSTSGVTGRRSNQLSYWAKFSKK